MNRKKLLAYGLLSVLLLSTGYVIGVSSNGGSPTWDENLGIYNVQWFNASVGVNAPKYVLNDLDVTDVLEYPEQGASYILFKDGSTSYLKNGSTGEIDYEGTDDATVIQYAVDKLISINKGCLIIKGVSERYDISQAITGSLTEFTNIEIIGVGRPELRLNDNANDDFFYFTGSDHYHRLKIAGLYLQGNRGNQASGSGIKLDGVDYWEITDNWIRDVKDHAVILLSAGTGEIFKNTFIGSENSTIHLAHGVVDVGISHNYLAAGTNQYAIEVIDSSNRILDNHIWGWAGIRVVGHWNLIENNLMEGLTSYGVLVYGASTSNQILGNFIKGVSSTSGIFLNGSSISGAKVQRTLVANNYIINCNEYAIDTDWVISNQIVGNYFYNSGDPPVNLWGASAFDLISNNYGYITENADTTTLVSGQTSIAVSHGCDYTPSAGDISVHPIESLGSASYWYVNTITSSQFTIRVDVNPAQDVDFAWSVERH